MIFIAEFCQNHNGDTGLLTEMVHAAKECGAEYAKIQTIFADMVSYRERFETGVIENGVETVIKRPYQSEYDRLKGLEITWDQQADFVDLCKKTGIKPLTTVFTRDSIGPIREVGFEEIKLASYDCASPPLLREVRKVFDAIFLSTGASYDHEVEMAAKTLGDADFSLLHCVTKYPTPLAEFHLSRMNYLDKFCSVVGWSDHSLIERDGILGTLAAIYYGAQVIERHFTLLPADQTKDGPVSVTPEHVIEMKKFDELDQDEMRHSLKAIFPDFEVTLGNANRELSTDELKNRDYFRGRFASKLPSNQTVYNWEETEI